jgi:hypothetical protein
MPAAQAVQAVSKAYVDQSIAALSQSQITASGGTLNGPLFLNGDPTQGLQAADKHYVDSAVSQANPVSVGNATSGQIAYYTGSGSSIGGMSTIPLASGGTGSATAAGALQNLGGISSSATSQQSMAGPLVASTNTEVNLQSPPNAAACDGTTDDTVNINAKLQLAGSLNAALIPTRPFFAGTVNAPQGVLKFPFGKTCKITGTLIVPPGVTVDLNTSTVKMTSTTADAIRISWDDITNRGSIAFYGDAFGGVKNGSIIGPGNTTSTAAGLFLYNGAYGDYENLNITGFKFGVSALERGYDIFKSVRTSLNVVGKYLTTRNGTNGLPVNITAFAGNTPITGYVTLTAANGFEQDEIKIAGCTGSNCPTALNGTYGTNDNLAMPPACEHGNCTTFIVHAPSVTTSASGVTGATATPTGDYAVTDDSFFDDMSNSNSKVGLWCQACTETGFFKADYSYNGEAEIVLGAQPGWADPAHTYFMSGLTGSFPSGSGCTANTNQPITVTGGTLASTNGSAAQAYAAINSSGQVSGVYVVDAGFGYSALPTGFSVATCAVQPTLTAVGTSDVGLGYFDGTTNVNRGLIGFYEARSESVVGQTGPNTGFAVEVNSAGFGGMRSVQFNGYCFGVESGGMPASYARMARNYGSQISFNDPGCTGAPWDLSSNPAAPGDVSAFLVAGGSIALRASQGFMANPQLAVIDQNHSYNSNNQTTDGFNTAGLHVSQGFQAFSSNADLPMLQGNDISDTTMRYRKDISGKTAIGSGAAAGDIGYCRLQSGRLGISDGAIGMTACNANGQLAAATAYLGTGGMRTLSPADEPIVVPGGGNDTAIYNYAAGGKVYFRDQGGPGLIYSPVTAASFNVGNYQILPSTLTGHHGNSTSVQFSDNTGTNGNLVKWASDGSTMDGPTPPTGAIVGTTDTQTLTNKSIAGSEINSGVVGTAVGGTGQDESSATGIGQFSSGAYSVSTALANGTTATTQTAGNNSTKVATTAYVASPGAIAPTTVTATGLVTGANDATRTTSTTIATTGFTTTGLVLPTVPVSTTKSGRCTIYWQMSSASYTTTFGFGMSSAPTNLWGGTSVTYAGAGTSNWLAFTQTATTATAISTAATAGVANATYRAEIDFTIQTGATNPVALTLYGQVSNASATLTVGPGSTCYWLP